MLNNIKLNTIHIQSGPNSFGMVPNATSVPLPYQQQVYQYQQLPVNAFGSNSQPVTTTQPTQRDFGGLREVSKVGNYQTC